jgi:hypothetical protein
MPRKEFESFTRLDASDVNTFLMDQTVMTFAGTAARGSAIATPTEGMVTYLADSDSFEFFDGTEYQPFGAADAPLLEYLVIAGGGSGGRVDGGAGGGGGGAGGYRTNISGALSGGSVTAELPLPIVLGTAYPIIVGAGGASVTSNNGIGNRGNRSVLASITSEGGGAGAQSTGQNSFGGSGGGLFNTLTVGSIQGQGSNGGNGTTGQQGAGGGGGAGAVGVTATSSAGQNGGAGLASSITGSSVDRGGGGGGSGTGGAGSGGTGGGGNGTTSGAGGNGTVNTGGGGGGTLGTNTGIGGSGVVIFSVITGTTVTFTGGVTETNSTVSGRDVYIVTATSTTSETVTFS